MRHHTYRRWIDENEMMRYRDSRPRGDWRQRGMAERTWERERRHTVE